MYDPYPTGRRLGPGLIAFLAVLAVVVGTASYFGTRSVLDGFDTPTAQGTGGPGGTTAPPVTTTPATAGGAQSTAVTTPPQTPPPTQVPPGDPSTCPQPTVDAIAQAGLDSNLTVQLYIRVHRAGEYDSEIWICTNADGLLIYQGHVLRGPLDVADNGQNTLLLADGIKGTVALEGTNGYLATNTNNGVTTEYHVGLLKLVQVNEPGDRNRQEYPVINRYQP